MPPDVLTGKAARLLLTGSVNVATATPRGLVLVDVHGDTGTWRVARTPAGRWSCSCPGWTYRETCSHRDAVAAITTQTATEARP